MHVLRIVSCIFLLLVIIVACEDPDLDLSQSICDSASPYYFSPDNRTFIAPAEGDFVRDLCHHSFADIDGFFDLNFSKICVVQENFRKIEDYIEREYCPDRFELLPLNAYHYQFLGIIINGSEHINLNAFQIPEFDTTGTFLNWTTDPVDTCGGGNKFWGALFQLSDGSLVDFGFNGDDQGTTLKPSSDFVLDPCTRCVPVVIDEYFTCSSKEVCSLLSNFEMLIPLASEGCYYNGRTVDFSVTYRYQYLGIVSRGKRYIYVNALFSFEKETDFYYDSFYDKYINVCDGAFAFWSVLFNLESLKFEHLEFNCC